MTIMHISRQYRSDHMFERPRINGAIFIVTMAVRYKYLDRNRHAQLFVNNSFFAAVKPMDKKSLPGKGLREFIKKFGFVDRLVCDKSKEQTSKGTDFMIEVRKHRIDLHVNKPDQHNQSNKEGPTPIMGL